MTEADEDRFQALRRAHSGLLGRFPGLKLDDMVAAFDGWHVEPVYIGEWIVGAFMTRGAEIHIAVEHMARGHWLTRQWLRTHVTPLLVRHGALKTSVSRDFRAGHEFVTRLGFEHDHDDAHCAHYTLRKLRHA